GVVLYVALTGRLPFAGPARTMLTRKLECDASSPNSVATGVPADLNALCEELLRRDPAARPSGPAILARLAESEREPEQAPTPTPAPASGSAATVKPEVLLIGRERHREALRAAFDSVRRGHPEVVLISGRSGSGRSTLIQAFLDDLSANDEA